MGSCETPDSNNVAHSGFHSSRHTMFGTHGKLSASWFDMRVFYVRISNFKVDDQTPEFLSVNHIPLDCDTLLEVNGVRCGIHSDGISSKLRRDRLDKKSEEATFVSTDSVRFIGSVRFEVFDGGDLFLTGVLEMPSSNGFIGESKDCVRSWSLNCDTEMAVGTGFLKVNRTGRPEYASPTIDVYVAGCFSGAPVILSKTLQLTSRKKQNKKFALDVIPEFESQNDGECQKNVSSTLDLQVAEYRDYKPGNEALSDPYWGIPDYMEGEDGELSWFNAGVRVGVGIGLGVCVGIGVGVGLLARTYQSTTRGFKRRLF